MKLYEVSYFFNSDESGTIYKTTTNFEGLENMYLDPGIEVFDYKEVEE